MKKIYSFLAAALVSATMFAAQVELNPVADYNFRTNGTVTSETQDTPTDWNSGYPKLNATTIECTYGAKMWGQQMYDVTNIDMDYVDSITITLYNANNNTYRLGAWIYPDANWTGSSERAWSGDPKTCPIVENFKTVVGAYPGHATTGFTYLVFSDGDVKNAFTLKFKGDALTALKNGVVTKEGRKYISFILTFRETNIYGSRQLIYYSLNADDASKRPVMTVAYHEDLPALWNRTQNTHPTDLATAVADAAAGDAIVLHKDATISGSRLEIKKELTIEGATGIEKLICGVSYNTLMVLANDNTADYTVTFKNLIVDGQNVERDRQLFDLNGKAKMAFEGVSVINATYSNLSGDVKTAGSNVILTGVNSFPAGIALNKNKRIDHVDATHTSPIRIILSDDYVADYAIVLHCADATLYTAVCAADKYEWELYVSNNELKGKKTEKTTTAIDNTNIETKAVKVIRNGQLFIIRDGVEYNALGQIVK